MNSYSEDIMKVLRQRKGLEEDDVGLDHVLNKLNKDIVFREVLNWNGFLGRWDIDIKQWILDIYGVDLDKIQ